MLKATRSLILILTVLFVASYSAFPSAIEICDLDGCSDELAQLTHEDLGSTTSEHSPLNCNCTSHSCSHVSVVMSRGLVPALALDFSDQFFDHYDFHLLAPFLEGPFQPPKA